MRVKTKFQIFLITNRHLLNFLIPFLVYVFYLSFIQLDIALITFCSGEQDPCIEALNESLKNLEAQKTSQGWLSRKANAIALNGGDAQIGTGVVEQGDKVYVAQTIEVKNKDGSVLRRITDCVSGAKKKK